MSTLPAIGSSPSASAPAGDRSRPGLRAAGLGALLLTLPLGAGASPGVFTWPGAPPCDAPNAQDCLLAVPDGAIVQLASNDPILSPLIVHRGITLTAAPGFLPILSAVRILGEGGIVHGLVVRGDIAIAPGAGMTSAKVADNIVMAAGLDFGIFVVDSDSPGQPPLELSIENNSVHGASICVNLFGLATLDAPSRTIVGSNRLDCGNLGVATNGGRAEVEISVSSNQIEAPWGISSGDRDPALVPKPRKLRLDVVANRVAASYGSGLFVVKDPTGGATQLTARQNVFTSGAYAVDLSELDSNLLSGEIAHNVFAFNAVAATRILGAPDILFTDNAEFENGP